MRNFPKPVVITSRCFEFDACRYNGQMIPNNFVQALEPWVEFRPVCPELEIGLGVPRDPVRIVRTGGGRSLVQPFTGRDLTSLMRKFSEAFLSSITDADGFILKSHSPSCGIRDAKEFAGAGNENASGKGPGLFSESVLSKFPGLAVEDEGRLRNFRLREHFLTKLYTLARWRGVKREGTLGALVSFHTENKFLLMSHSQKEMRALGRVTANAEVKNAGNVIAEYDETLIRAISSPQRRPSAINTLMHALGYFKDSLSGREKAYFLALLLDYRNKRIPLSAVLTVLESWVIKYEQDYLARQTFFEPYPRELMDLSDSGKGRDL
jgi:uncharacterized protein YbgA (DUF1722 family)/uncharacterized protein YbbK (DUF523 family)